MTTFRVLEDENVADRIKRKFAEEEEEMDVIENVSKKRGFQQRPALQNLNNDTKIDIKRLKTRDTQNVRTIPVDGCKRENKVDDGSSNEEDVNLQREQTESDHLPLSDSESEKTCPFPKELENNDEYREDMYQHLTQLELRYEWPTRNCIEKQTHITVDMRSVLVDWLITVAEEYQMSPQTIHLTVNYIDRFISKMLVVTHKFQLLGATAMLIASKMEEIYPPDTKEFVYLSGDAYTVQQIVKMEQLVLKVLKFDLQPPTVLSFITHMCTEHKLDKKTLYLSMYISELALLDGIDFFEYLPSKLAAASVALARLTLSKRKPWPKQLVSFSGYTLRQLSPIVKKQYRAFGDSPHNPQKAVHGKYMSDKYQNVAALQPRNLALEYLDEE